jgi:hypothetical protein
MRLPHPKVMPWSLRCRGIFKTDVPLYRHEPVEAGRRCQAIRIERLSDRGTELSLAQYEYGRAVTMSAYSERLKALASVGCRLALLLPKYVEGDALRSASRAIFDKPRRHFAHLPVI